MGPVFCPFGGFLRCERLKSGARFFFGREEGKGECFLFRCLICFSIFSPSATLSQLKAQQHEEKIQVGMQVFTDPDFVSPRRIPGI